MEVKGFIKEIGELQQVTDSFKKRELILEYAENPQYPEFVKFEAIQDKTSLLDGLKVNDEVEVSFNLKGREWTDKSGKKQYFNSLHIWKVNFFKSASVSNNEVSTQINNDENQLPF